MKINIDNLCLPVSQTLATYIVQLITDHDNNQAITINFRDPTYSADAGGFHPVEIRLEKDHSQWNFSYITDFCYVGSGYMADLAKDLDFDFGCGVFQNLVGTYPLEQARDIYQMWERNFLSYCIDINVFKIEIGAED
nr:DUF2787 family protein [Shewanella benthica]